MAVGRIGQRSCRYPTPVGSAGGAEEAEVGEHRQLRRQRPHEVVGEELKLGHATISAHITHCQLQWVAAAQPAFS